MAVNILSFFFSKKKWMEKRGVVNERLLFHGTRIGDWLVHQLEPSSAKAVTSPEMIYAP
jgi:hypothetical protein